MADRDGGVEPACDDGLRDRAQSRDLRVARLVDVEVDREVVPLGEREEAVEPGLQVRHGVGDAAQDAARRRDEVGRVLEGIVHEVDADEARGLQRHPVAPVLAHLAEHAPRDVVLRRDGVEMGAHGAGAVGVGAGETEGHARPHVLRRPAGGAVRRHRFQRAGERAVRVRRARPDVALVQMGVHVRERGQRHRALQVQPVRRGLVGERAVADVERGRDEVAVAPEQAGGHRDVVERDVARGKLGEIRHASRFTADSCHLRRAR